MADRIPIPTELASKLLIAVRHRCCICPEHRRIANIHHLDQDPSNNTYENLICLCAECHADAHTRSSMRRNLSTEQLKAYKSTWETQCKESGLSIQAEQLFSQIYYLNVHRFDNLYKQARQSSCLQAAPCFFVSSNEHYNTLWANPKNSLDWVGVLHLKSYLDDCFNSISPSLELLHMALIEGKAIRPEEHVGRLFLFDGEFFAQDVPDQSDLERLNGQVDGPPATLRRTIVDDENHEKIEFCLTLDPTYFYSDSAFVHLSERGRKRGVALLGSIRDVGSSDFEYGRTQLLFSPIVIGF